MTEQIQTYFAIIQRYFGLGIAAFVALQPLLILITSAAHAIEVQGRNRGWPRVQACGYWVAKVCGTFAAVDMRNVQRVGGKVFVILAEVIAAWSERETKKAAVTKAMNDAGRLLILALAIGVTAPLSGCTALSLHTTIEKALVFEQQAQSQSVALKSMADAIIPTLPLDKQDEARSKVADLYVKLSESFAAKDALLQAALDASESKVDIGKIAIDIVAVVGEIVSLLKVFGVAGDQLVSLEAQGAALKVSAGRL